MRPCPTCGRSSHLAAISGDCLACTMGWDEDGMTIKDRAAQFAQAHGLTPETVPFLVSFALAESSTQRLANART